MKLRLCFLLLLPLAALSQKNDKGYFSITALTAFKANADPAFGASLSGNVELAKAFFIGGQIGLVKFPLHDGVYVPLQAKFTVAPQLDSKKIGLLVLLEPGYGVYNKTLHAGSNTITQQGSFTFFGGLGGTFPGKGKGRAFLAAGYSLFGFKTNDVRNDERLIEVRAGVMLR